MGGPAAAQTVWNEVKGGQLKEIGQACKASTEISKRIWPNSDIAGKLWQKEGGKKIEILIGRNGPQIVEIALTIS